MDGLDALLIEPTIWNLVSASFIFGLVGGIKPGPLITLVITETLQHDWKAGTKVALSPLITDAPIITISAWMWSQATSMAGVESILYLAGATFLTWLSIDGLRGSSINIDDIESPREEKSLRRGVITNLLNPNPWMFWTLAGAPFMVAAWNQSPWMPLAFVIPFFTMLIGTKILIAITFHRSKEWMSDGGLLWAIRISSIALLAMAVLFGLRGVSTL
ncbi:MAG TPA: LysE family transporter [Candidatus Thalassarchaeaceae archaeon]|jgi:threonine/homoserine/homoserine lactone efflux protein|nr:LysE family transporter [Candidatus Thalassarchaeaceae archaeon]